MKEHTKEYGLYYWDTFDNRPAQTTLFDEADTLEDAIQLAHDHYGGQMRPDGADRVDIVDSAGDIVRSFKVG